MELVRSLSLGPRKGVGLEEQAMTFRVRALSISIAILCTSCVAGPGGSNNAANRAVTGAAVGALLGGVAGQAVGMDAMSGAVTGAVAGGALGAAVNPNELFRRDTRGYCYKVDEQGRPYYDEQGQVIYDYTRRC